MRDDGLIDAIAATLSDLAKMVAGLGVFFIIAIGVFG